MALVDIRQLGISFGGLRAVDNFNLTMDDGQLYGLIGPNGAGKTTIFNLLTGVYKPTDGEFYFDGELMNGKTPIQINKKGIARTFQNIRLFSNMSVIDNVKTGLQAKYHYSMLDGILRLPKFGRMEREMTDRAMELLKIFDLDGEAEQLASNLPYGKQRKLEIARALATDPKLLLLDEPAAGMNPNETAELMNTISLIREKFKVSILLIEHDMSLVMGICEKIVVLLYGRVIANGIPDEIKNDPKVIVAYLGE